MGWCRPSSCVSWHRREVGGRGEESTPFGYCSQIGCARLQVACRRRSGVAGREEFLPCLTRDVSHGWQNLQTPDSEHTLNLALDIIDGVGRLDLKGDGLTREGLDKDLHVEDLELRRRQVSSSLF